METLFAPFFDVTIVNRPSEVSPISAAHLDHNQVPDSPQQTTTTVGRDGPPIASPTTAEQTGSIKEHVEKGTVELYFVRTEYKLEDLLTKALHPTRFADLVHQIDLRCLTLDYLQNFLKN